MSSTSSKEGTKARFDVLIEYNKAESVWTARCLQMNLLVDGDTIDEVKQNIQDCVIETILIAIERGISPEMFEPAPQKYWDEVARIKESIGRRKKKIDLEKIRREIQRLSESRESENISSRDYSIYEWDYANAVGG